MIEILTKIQAKITINVVETENLIILLLFV